MTTLLVFLTIGFQAPNRSATEPIGTLRAPALAEVSGIVASRTQPGVFWVHNDSGNPSELYAVRRDGSLIRTFKVGIPNTDWEDIAADHDGNLYIGDTGNNGARLPLRVIHCFKEPKVDAEASKPIVINRSYYYTFPKDGRFDCEAIFVEGTTIYLVSKRLDRKPAELYAIDTDKVASLVKPAKVERLGKFNDITDQVTAADLSADGTRLAVLTEYAVYVYKWVDGTPVELLKKVPLQASQYEAVCWDGDRLLVASEDRRMIRTVDTFPAKPEGRGR